MKKTSLTLLLLVIGFLPITGAMAVMAVAPDDSSRTPAITTESQFGLSGIISHYSASKSLIVINGISYTLSGKGDLSDADLQIGQQIKFNVERSSNEYQGRITRIWIEQ